jgi:hypothetical protein
MTKADEARFQIPPSHRYAIQAKLLFDGDYVGDVCADPQVLMQEMSFDIFFDQRGPICEECGALSDDCDEPCQARVT